MVMGVVISKTFLVLWMAATALFLTEGLSYGSELSDRDFFNEAVSRPEADSVEGEPKVLLGVVSNKISKLDLGFSVSYVIDPLTQTYLFAFSPYQTYAIRNGCLYGFSFRNGFLSYEKGRPYESKQDLNEDIRNRLIRMASKIVPISDQVESISLDFRSELSDYFKFKGSPYYRMELVAIDWLKDRVRLHVVNEKVLRAVISLDHQFEFMDVELSKKKEETVYKRWISTN